jgi:ABC-type branched-subunit amino acid transport system substrate-binding protein
MRLARVLSVAIAGTALLVLGATGVTNAAHNKKAAGSPIVIGAAVDLTKNMAPFDAPALTAAQLEIKKINAAGGVDGHPLVLKFINTSSTQQTEAGGDEADQPGAVIGW